MSLAEVFNLEQQEPNIWRAAPRSSDTVWPRLYGGQVAAQALLAASFLTLPEHRPHSLQVTYLRPGRHDTPVDYEVHELQNGRSFSRSIVIARQAATGPILQATASFHVPESGLNYAVDMPPVPNIDPNSLPKVTELLERFNPSRQPKYAELSDIDVRAIHIDPHGRYGPYPDERMRSVFWARTTSLMAEAVRHDAVTLTYLTDLMALETTLFPHGRLVRDDELDTASLSHTVWFHAQLDPTQWLLLHHHSVWTGAARGLALGQVFTSRGDLVASIAQEGLLRPI